MLLAAGRRGSGGRQGVVPATPPCCACVHESEEGERKKMRRVDGQLRFRKMNVSDWVSRLGFP